jgi:bifunctional UDP-N-acetylglucosamine pyrophosphorylase/glucosamine-1-phosphate N-acetyltransferase
MLDILILAAGKGSRMKSELPKVLHTIAGKPLVEHVINAAKPLTGLPMNCLIGHGADKVQKALGEQHNYILQAQQLGTGHAVQQALPYFHEGVIVLILYGDVRLIKTATLERLIACASTNSLGLLTVELENPKGYGRIIRDAEQKVTSIVEQKDASEKQLLITEVNTGIMAVNSNHLKQWLPLLSNGNAQGEYYLTDIIAMAQQQGVNIETEQPDNEWEVLGVNDRRQQAELERIFQQNLAEQLLIDGVTLMDSARFDCRGELTVGNDVVIDINCIFKGQVVIADGVTIGANCIIENSTIGAGTIIKDNSILEDATVNTHCVIGPFARLRPGTCLEDKAKIGNFVETKKAIIGKGSKINHLSYVGDAVLGENVNIGAGTITCNYDGVNKHQTTIGDNVFVGSNTALVAPVILETGSTIGAGSIINKSVEKNTLALTRAPQKSHKDWQRPTKKQS